MTQGIVILDFGSQYTQLIARRIRDMDVYCEIHPCSLSQEEFEQLSPIGIILSGGPASATVDANPKAPDWVFSSSIPVLGICYGMQIMALQLGGRVSTSKHCEFGYAKLAVLDPSSLLEGIADSINPEGQAILDVWMSHGDTVSSVPPGFDILAKSHNTDIAAMAHQDKPWYALQFHPEVTHTPQGIAILQRFVIDICKAQSNWTSALIIDETIAAIREQVGREKVLLALSGGVDSSVAANLLHQAIGSQLICVFVDTGLLRDQEAEQVLEMFVKNLHIKVIAVDAKERFLQALKNREDPEEKRKIIGRLFIEVFEEEALKIKKIGWLAQGTIYPDVIESAATATNQETVLIKSHHNVGGLPKCLQLKLLEPLRKLFKDEVRQMGLALGLPKEMVYRHPFPGPGLAVRILGEVKEEYLNPLRAADAIFMEELHRAGLYQKVSQAFAVFLPVKSVGVKGDGRTYEHVICLRAVETLDFMTAEWSQLPWDFLSLVSNRIINEIRGISRVVYDISGKPPATIEWE